MTRPTRAAKSLGNQLVELGTVAPRVVGRRLDRIAQSGPVPSASDQAEMARMSSEKLQASYEAWEAMSRYSMGLASAYSTSLWSMWMPWALPTRPLPSAPDMMMNIAGAGLRPYLRIAKANDKRLAKARGTSK